MKRKKLTEREFSYLPKYTFKNYSNSLENFAKSSTNWSKNFNHLVNISVSSIMRCEDFNYGYIYVNIGYAIDLAWLIFIQSDLQKCKKEELFLNHKHEIACSCNNNLGIYPPDFLARMFRFKTHREWYEIMDELIESFSITSLKDSFIQSADSIIPIAQFLTNLPIALQTIHAAGGIEKCMEHKLNSGIN